MMIPNFENEKFVDEKGFLTDQWALIMQQLLSALQTNVGTQGFNIPQLSAANIATLQTNYAATTSPSAYFGVMLYDVDNNLLNVNINGTFKVISTV
jgi:hypothetical protein